MLLGTHDHALDDKNRLTLPARLRERLGDEVVVTQGLDGCLYVYARADWDRLAVRVGELVPFSREARSMQRFFFGSGTELELDKQGRMLIPGALLERAGIGREVTVVGVRDHLELWDRNAWRQELQAVEGSAEDVAERLANRD